MSDDRSSSRRRPIEPHRAARTRRIVNSVLLLIAAVVIVDALVGDRGLIARMRARTEYAALEASIGRQRAENARLREEVRRLREDPDAIEELARRDLGLIRPGERVFIVRDLTRPTKP